VTTHWLPSTTLHTLRQRATLLAAIRLFFASRDVIEVETPALMPTTATDIYIDSYRLADSPFFLQTSPEFSLKRLLAAGSGSIYQLGKVFRQDASSKRHNHEFTLCEWYRVGMNLAQLMDEVEALVHTVFAAADVPRGMALKVERFSYRTLFETHLGIDPHGATLDQLALLAERELELVATDLSRTDYLQLLLSHCIEPNLPAACFIFDYPVGQAALARIEEDDTGQRVARRFELFLAGMEVANGYFELLDEAEQRTRFEADIAERARRGYEAVPLDEALLAALAAGMPECSGVALGVDRLVMAALGIDDIADVIAFPQIRR